MRNPIAKARNHPLLESGVGFLIGERFVEKFVHIFFLLEGLATVRAVDEMRVKRIAFRCAQFAVEIGGEQLINLFVNRWHKIRRWPRVWV